MNKSKWVLVGILGITLVFGLMATGCSTTGGVQKAEWSNYTNVPSKDYTVVGIIILRGDDIKTISADLMAKAVELGADDIINVRIDSEFDNKGKQKIVAGTAIAIKYGETLTASQTLVTDTASVTDKAPVMGSAGASGSGGAAENKKKGLFGWGFLGL